MPLSLLVISFLIRVFYVELVSNLVVNFVTFFILSRQYYALTCFLFSHVSTVLTLTHNFHIYIFACVFIPFRLSRRYYFSCINAIQIQLMNWVWDMVARRLTDFENHRTQNRHDWSLLLKSFLFKMINNYISLFYMGFLQQYDPWVENCGGDACLFELQVSVSDCE